MKKYLILIFIGVLTFASCNPFEDCDFEDTQAIAVVLNLEEISKSVNNIHIYGFSASDKLDMHKYYDSRESLEADRLYISSEGYTIIAVINVGSNFAPPESIATKAELPNIMLTDFIVWLDGEESKYPNIMTGIGKNAADSNGVMTITIKINDGVSNLHSTTLRLNVTIPEGELPDHQTRVENHNIRIVTEVYKKGSATRIHSNKKIFDGSTHELKLQPGDYDVLMWADYTPAGTDEDHHYTTSTLRSVSLNANVQYTPNAESRNAFSHRFDVSVESVPVTEKAVTLNHLTARYKLVATDVEHYKTFIADKQYPAMEDLTITISYDGYFPNSFDVATGRPNDSAREVKYNSVISNITETTAELGSDYIFTSEEDSHINATITIFKSDGDVLTRIPGVIIGYHRGFTSTVEADFLTAGTIDKGITIDTEWAGEINVYF